jgi:microcin C transport system substrate-binding protein
MKLLPALACALLLPFAVAPAAAAEETVVSHGMSLVGELSYPADFPHLRYADPKALKGGEIRAAGFGTFDSLNPFIIKGHPAGGLGLVYETLFDHVSDAPNEVYALLAESVEYAKDRSWVAFTLNGNARFHDGKPVTPEDVIFSFQLLKEKGAPLYRHYYANVEKAERTGPLTVKFSFAGPANRELPFIVSELIVLPKHFWESRDFGSTTLEPPLGSGPYRVKQVDPGRSITYERVKDHWARDLPINRGRYNFDVIRYEYFRDPTIALEAFKSHAFDYRLENSAKAWATAYDFPARRDGAVVTEELEDKGPAGMQGFVFNTRRPLFQDRKVREALGYTFDFEWSNTNLFYGQYTRTDSYFENSELAATGLPGPAELELLEPLRGQIPEEVFTTAYAPPTTDGEGGLRANLRNAARLLREAGWEVRNGALTHGESGRRFDFEILLAQPDMERVVAPMVENMRRLGLRPSIRIVDTSQYVSRVQGFDFDMIVGSFGQSLSPGNEQRDFWGSEAANRPGSRNLIGIEDPAIDKLVDRIIYAPDREALVAACRALDRVLLWRHYAIPQFHNRVFRLAYWDRFGRPERHPGYAVALTETWWLDPEKQAALASREAKYK